jgi:hypothetical protein
VQEFDMEAKQYRSSGVKLQSQTGLHLRKTWIIIWASVGLGKVLEYKNFVQS